MMLSSLCAGWVQNVALPAVVGFLKSHLSFLRPLLAGTGVAV